MRIDDELYRIAAAKYGLDLKDPVFSAFDRLSTDTKFDLAKDFLNDDYAEFSNAMTTYYTTKTTCKTIRNIFDLLLVLNGRKGFFAKSVSSHGHYDENRIHIWIDMLAKELLNSGTGLLTDGVCCKGSGIVNGSKIRAAVYNILDILQCKTAAPFVQPVISAKAPYCILGKPLGLDIYGTEDGLGFYQEYVEPVTLTSPAQTISGYYCYVIFRNLFTGETTIKEALLGEDPLMEGHSATYVLDTSLPYSLYEISIGNQYPTDLVETDINITYNAIRDLIIPNPNDYIYELYGQQNLNARTIFYKGTDSVVAVPDTFGTGSLKEIGSTTFMGSSVSAVYIPDGVTTIG